MPATVKRIPKSKMQAVVMYCRGYTVDDICRTTGIPKGSLYGVFKSFGLTPSRPVGRRSKDDARPRLKALPLKIGKSLRNKIRKIYRDGYTYQEIADTIGVPKGSVAHLLRRVRVGLSRRTSVLAEKERRIKMLCRKHWTVRQIADEMGMEEPSIRYVLTGIRRGRKRGRKAK